MYLKKSILAGCISLRKLALIYYFVNTWIETIRKYFAARNNFIVSTFAIKDSCFM